MERKRPKYTKEEIEKKVAFLKEQAEQIKAAGKNAVISKFAYLAIQDNKRILKPGSYLKNFFNRIQFFKILAQNPFGPNGIELLKNIEPEVGKVYVCSRGRVFGYHPKYGLIKLMGIQNKNQDPKEVKIEDLKLFTENKFLVEVEDMKARMAKMAKNEKDQK